MTIYNNTLDYIFTSDIMLEMGWDSHPLRVRKQAQKELLELRKENSKFQKQNKSLVDALGFVKELDHCIYERTLSGLIMIDSKLAKEIFIKFKENWDTGDWEEIEKYTTFMQNVSNNKTT